MLITVNTVMCIVVVCDLKLRKKIKELYPIPMQFN